jgi:LPXTG-motif cell wall-anchored protein
MRDVNVPNAGLSAPYIATLAAMDGSGSRHRTLATTVAALLALLLALSPTSLAQSAGDRQYSDPLVTDGGGDSDDGPAADGPDAPVSSDDPAPTTGDSGTVAPPAGAEPAVAADSTATTAALPHTGADPLPLALAGLLLTAAGGLGLAVARRPRDARR